MARAADACAGTATTPSADLPADALERLELILGGPVFFQTLRAAVDLDLFTLLARQAGASQEQLTAWTGVQTQPLRILLLGCTALGLIERRDDGYYNSPLADRLLSRDSDQYLGAAIAFAHRLVYRAMFHMTEALRANTNLGLGEIPGEGRTLYERLRHQPALERVFQEGLQATSRLNVEQLLAQFDFTQVHHVLDVGGGNGTALCALASRHPHLRGTVLETASVCALAHERIAASGLSDRIATRAGDSFADPFPRGADCVLFMHFMSIWSAQANVELLRKSHAVLPPGGHVLVFDGAQANDRRGPLRAARWSPYFLVLSSGEGMFYTPDEYAGWMTSAGFVDVRYLQTGVDHVVVMGRRA